jgi:endoglucanase
VTNPQTATELVASWGLGWNLGNSLDVPESETTWGNPVVDPSLLTAIADAGFEVVRIPVTWSMFTGSGPNFTIDSARMARVEEVVGYVLDAGMDAIINLHHDGADEYDGVEWLTLTDDSGNISETVNADVEARFRAVWTQIATHFASFDDRLLFESMNEIHDGYDAPDTGYYAIINRLNQTFVDVVRGTGGNNDQRKLVVPGYNTNIDYTVAGFQAPQDPATDRLILSVHFYDPWSFAGEGATAAWGSASPGTDSWGQEDYVVGQFDKLQTTYINQGLPVIIGEYGAINRTGSESYRRYYMEYVTQAACQRGIAPIYWDNGGVGSGADNFGLIERSSKEVVFPEILDAMFRGCRSDGPLDSIAKP